VPHGEIYRLSLRGQKGLDFLKKIKFVSNRKSQQREKYLQDFPKNNRRLRWHWEENDIAWLPIEKIEDSGKQRVYDMTVPGSHSFLANAIVTHNSFDIQRDLKNIGINSETLSVAKKHYEDLAMLFYEERVVAPHIDILLDELLELKIMPNNRVDHPRKKSKDLADAMCGSVYNAISRNKRERVEEIEIHSWDNVKIINKQEQKKEIPEDIREYLINAGIL